MTAQADELAVLRAEIRAVGEAVDRLARETLGPRPGSAAATGPPRRPRPTRAPPGARGQAPAAEPQMPELIALGRLLDLLRELLPSALQEQLPDFIRELLILIRTVVDWAVTRLEPRPPPAEVEIQDIPVS